MTAPMLTTAKQLGHPRFGLLRFLTTLAAFIPAGRWLSTVVYGGLLLVSMLIGCVNLSHSGLLWSDGPQYANAGAMIHDWLNSGEILHPYDFARQNYARYPAFHIPYHPPVYPALLGMFFSVA